MTYYWIGEDQWGDTIARPCKDKHKAIEGHTIAVDPDVIPLGSKVLIDGHVYVAEDVGGAVKGNVIDIYSSSPRLIAYETKIYIKEKE
ncbi:MAG: 3D domain-containing protein [[Clostridium] innocuum]|uniref:3D domain-containing protein n=1 Tax=Clostridium innocuum TaxID=1522 RepID=UPI0009ECB8F8